MSKIKAEPAQHTDAIDFGIRFKPGHVPANLFRLGKGIQ